MGKVVRCEKCGYEIKCPQNDLPKEGLIEHQDKPTLLYRKCSNCGHEQLVGTVA